MRLNPVALPDAPLVAVVFHTRKRTVSADVEDSRRYTMVGTLPVVICADAEAPLAMVRSMLP